MMRNRGPHMPAMKAGSGLLGEGPGISSGMKRMMAGVGGSLLGSAPKQQPRSLLNTPGLGQGVTEHQRGGLFDRPEYGERVRQSYNQQAYSQGGGLEQQTDTGYYDERGGGYMEEQPSYQQEYGSQDDGLYRTEMRPQEQYGHRDQEYDYNQRGTGTYHESESGTYREPASYQRSLSEEQPSLRRGLMEQPRSLLDEPVSMNRQMDRYDGRGLLERPAETRSLLGLPGEQRGLTQHSTDQQGHVGMQYDQHHSLLETPREQHAHDPHRSQPGLLRSPREHGFMDNAREQHGMDIEREQHGFTDNSRDRRGLMDAPRHFEMAEPPKPPRALMEMQQEPRSLLNMPVEPRSLRDSGGEPRSLLDMNQRGLMDHPREERGPRDQRGLLDFPGEQRQRVKSAPRQRNDMNRQSMKQSDLMEKADLQMKLLQQQEKIREMEQMELLKQQQQAVLMQHQQQHMQQMQQQQQIQQQLQIKQQMQQAELLMNAGKNQSRGGGIPSLLDVPTRGKTVLGKRPSVASRGADNKRAKAGPIARRDRNPPQRDRKNSSRDRLGGRRQDRRGRNRSRHESPDRKKRDRKDSGPRSKTSTPNKDRLDKGKESRSEKGKEKNEKEKEKDKEKDKAKSDKTVSEQYDPAEPTEDVEVKVEIIGEDGKPVEEMEVGETDKKTEKKTEKEETKEDGKKDGQDEEKDDKQKHQEISLTVTVNKKGRSVNDVDTKDVKKQTQGKMYKCKVCNVECYDEESFSRHMNGKKHSEKMKIVMSSSSQQALLIKSRLQAEEHLRQIEGSKRTAHTKHSPVGSAGPKGKALETHCKVCDKKFTGAYKDHKEAPEHKGREDRSKAGCKVCKVSTFSTYQDYLKHLKSNWHLKKMKQDSWPECKLCNQKFKSPRKFVQHCKTDHHIQNKKKLPNEEDEDELGDLVTLDTVGYEEDASTDQERKEKDMDTDSSVFLKPLPVDKEPTTSTPKTTSKAMKVDAVTPVKPEEEEIVVPETYDPSLPVGQKYVVPVSGFFCKLCHKFYNNETAAKVTHCQSQPHYDKLKKVIDTKRTKAEEMAKKSEVTQSLFGKQSEDKDNETSQTVNESIVENGNQSTDTTVDEEPSQYETADEHNDSTVNDGDQSQDSEIAEGNDTVEDQTQDSQVTEGNDTVDEEEMESTVNDLEENEDSKDAKEKEVEQKVSGVRQQRARRGGGTARTRRGRK